MKITKHSSRVLSARWSSTSATAANGRAFNFSVGNTLTKIVRFFQLAVMVAKLFPAVLVIGLTIWVGQVQSQLLTGTPTESASPSKHRMHKKTEATPSAETTRSPSVESPAPLPKPKRIRRKTTAEVPASPTPTPVASPTPHKFRFPRLFKPKRSPSASPSGGNSAPAIGSGAGAGASATPR